MPARTASVTKTAEKEKWVNNHVPPAGAPVKAIMVANPKAPKASPLLWVGDMSAIMDTEEVVKAAIPVPWKMRTRTNAGIVDAE